MDNHQVNLPLIQLLNLAHSLSGHHHIIPLCNLPFSQHRLLLSRPLPNRLCNLRSNQSSDLQGNLQCSRLINLSHRPATSLANSRHINPFCCRQSNRVNSHHSSLVRNQHGILRISLQYNQPPNLQCSRLINLSHSPAGSRHINPFCCRLSNRVNSHHSSLVRNQHGSLRISLRSTSLPTFKATFNAANLSTFHTAQLQA